MTSPEIVVVGASAGALDAFSQLLSSMPPALPFALVLVQHRARTSEALCEVLQHYSASPVSEIGDKDPIEAGHVYVAPADYHLLIEEGYFALSLDPPEFFSRPSIDQVFETAADAYRSRAAGVVLTGANRDGARGLRRIADRGGWAFVQDPATAEVPVMPLAALSAVPEARVVTLAELSGQLLRPGSAAARQAPGQREREARS